MSICSESSEKSRDFKLNANSPFSLSSSIASLSSSTSTSSSYIIENGKRVVKMKKLSANSIKISPEYRALRQQLFTLTSTHNSLKLAHEREKILAEQQRNSLQEQVQKLQEQVDEVQKDQVFILNSEKEALKATQAAQEAKELAERTLLKRISQLETELAAEKDANYASTAQLTKLQMKLQQTQTDQSESLSNSYDESFVANLLAEWKEKVRTLSSKVSLLEEQLDSLNSNNSNSMEGNSNSEDPEVLRQKILSTFVSLEAAQIVLKEKKAEADRLSSRIGNVKILEEKHREAQMKINRLEKELNEFKSTQKSPIDGNESQIHSPTLSASSSASDLKFIQMTQELGNLKESLTLAHLNNSSLQDQLNSSQNRIETLQMELNTATTQLQKLQTSLKVKESTISNLKEQLDSTVNLLTETLKKRKGTN
jgi:chromosome segregation ATPase